MLNQLLAVSVCIVNTEKVTGVLLILTEEKCAMREVKYVYYA